MICAVVIYRSYINKRLSEALPAASETPPASSEPVQADSETLPAFSGSLQSDSGALPFSSDILPAPSEVFYRMVAVLVVGMVKGVFLGASETLEGNGSASERAGMAWEGALRISEGPERASV